MVKVNFVRESGETLSTEVPVGYTIMEAAKQLDLPEICPSLDTIAGITRLSRA